jgi:hypothetical protein
VHPIPQGSQIPIPFAKYSPTKNTKKNYYSGEGIGGNLFTEALPNT